MQQEQQFQIGDRVVINTSDEHKGFYGVVEELRPTHCDVRMYDGKLAMWISDDYLQKVDPYDIRYVMPWDVLENEHEIKRKVWDVRPYIVGLSLGTPHKIFWDFLERAELVKEYKIAEPVGNAEQKDEWEEITASDLEVGDRFILWSDQNPISWEEVATHPEDKFIDGNGNHEVAFITAQYSPKLGRYDNCDVRSIPVGRTVYRKKRKE